MNVQIRCRSTSSLICATAILVGLVLAPGSLRAQRPIDEDSPWPRTFSTNGSKVTLHLPQVERWTSNSFVARAVVEVKPAGAKQELFGVTWFEARGSVDRSKRVVTLDRLEITRASFPDATDGGSNALAILREALPAGARTVSLDYLVTALGFEQAAARTGKQGLKHEPPRIIWATNRTTLIIVDGVPVMRPVKDTSLERVINTPALLVRNRADDRFYLNDNSRWFAAATVAGPWSLIQTPSPEIAALTPTNATAPTELPATQIIVSPEPAELLITSGFPDFRPIRGTALLYAADSDSLLFQHTKENVAYLLISGRWFKSASLHGPWSYVSPHDLPDDFKKIPLNSPQAVALASVPDTPQAELALIASSAPTTATVNRRTAKIDLTYDGPPKFKPIEGTTMSYAVNAQLPVIQLGDKFFAVDNAVWFTATSATGPWQVAAEVPEEIYTIPPSSPVYYATFVRVYDADEESVETGYTSGYQGAYEDDGTMVYGTGYDYEPYYSDDYYYGWGWTWGYSYWYVPWYSWWVWRPWWGESGGLRAALIENIYDRWHTPGVTPHDRLANAASIYQLPQVPAHPALWGRFLGSRRPIAQPLPVSTLALNPYARPATPARAGEMPRGAQLLSNVRQSSGGGRDLYASPDGNVYLRKPDGWYRRQGGGNWSYFAPTQGKVDPQPGGAPRGGGIGGSAGNRISPNVNASAAKAINRNRVPDAGDRMEARQVAELERQHYARTLSQMRSANVRPNYNASRPVRSGGGGRRR